MKGDRSYEGPVFRRRQLSLNNLGSSLLPIVAKLSGERERVAEGEARQEKNTAVKQEVLLPPSLRRDVERLKESHSVGQEKLADAIKIERTEEQWTGAQEISCVAAISRILIVHTDRWLAGKLGSDLFLRLKGCTLALATDVNSAISWLRQQDFDLVILEAGLKFVSDKQFSRLLSERISNTAVAVLNKSTECDQLTLKTLGIDPIESLSVIAESERSKARTLQSSPIGMPLQHLKKKFAPQVTALDSDTELNLTVGSLAGEQLSDRVKRILSALSHDLSGCELH